MLQETFREGFFDRFHKFSGEVLSGRMLGFAFSRAWVFIAFFGAEAFTDLTQRTSVANLFYEGSLVALTVTLLICGLLSKRCECRLSGTFGQVISALFCIIGTSVFPFANLDSSLGIALIFVAAVTTGFGSALLVLLWGKVYQPKGGPTAAAEMSVAYVIAALFVPVCSLLGPIFQQIVITILPIASCCLVAVELKHMNESSGDEQRSELLVSDEEHKREAVGEGSPAPSEAPAEASQKETQSNQKLSGHTGILIKFSVAAVVFGSVVSLARSFCTTVSLFTVGSYIIVFPLAGLLVAVVMIVLLLTCKNFDIAYSYRIVLLSMALGCLMMPFIFMEMSWIPLLSYVFILAGYFCFEIVSWIMISDIGFRCDVPSFRAYGFGRASVSGGVLIGAVLASLFVETNTFTFSMLVGVSCLLVLVVVIICTLVLTERDVARLNRRMYRKRWEAEEAANSLEERVDALAEEYQISGRMKEILLLLAQGRSVTRIEQELYISRGSINTYSHRLYVALGIHNRQELLDLVYNIDPDA